MAVRSNVHKDTRVLVPNMRPDWTSEAVWRLLRPLRPT